MARKLVIDTSSIISFFRYYYFDRGHSKTVYDSLADFLTAKIRNKEIIILDKVYDELGELDREMRDFKERIKDSIEDTKPFYGEIGDIVQQNLRFGSLTGSEIDLEIERYSEQADGYLILCCKHLKGKGVDAILITEETTSNKNYTKAIEKIPNICKKEKIEYRNIPHALFEIYKDELKFKLDVKSAP